MTYGAVWDNKDMFIKECGVCADIKYTIIIPQSIYDNFLTLLKEITTEWLLYLTYTKEVVTDRDDKVKGIIFNTDGYKIPEQQVAAANAKALNADEIVQEINEERPDHGAPGVIHAHQFTSSTFFSGTDQGYVNSNNAFSLVINRDGNFKAVAREKLECGRWLIKEAEVCVKFVENPEIVSELKDHIKSTYSRPFKAGGGGGRSSDSQSSRAISGRGRSGSRVFTTDVVPITSRRIKDCPHVDDPSECEQENYFGCEYYWIECPKKKGVPKGTLPKELIETEETTETTEETETTEKEPEEAKDDPTLLELLKPEDAKDENDGKKEETTELAVVPEE